MPFASSIQRTVFAFLIISAVVLAVYSQTLRFEFVNFDDPNYISQNPHIQNGLTFQGLKWAFTADLLFDSLNVDYWQPVTVISRMIDISLFGMHAGGHHAVNVLLHLLNSCLLFYLFYSITNQYRGGLLLALLFAVHPMQAEAVSWVTARKDLLSAFFAFLSIATYLKHARKPSIKSQLLVCLFFILGLMSKPVIAVLPVIFVFMDTFIFKRINIVEKLPLLLIGFCFSLIPILGPAQAVGYASLPKVLCHAVTNYLWYLQKFFYPVNLGILSPPLEIVINLKKTVLVFFLLSTITGLTFLARKGQPYLLAGWIWFGILLLPSSLISTPADRFIYLSSIGLCIMVICILQITVNRLSIAKNFRIAASILLVGALAVLSFKQAGYWKNSKSIFERSIRVSSDNFMMANNLGNVLFREGKADEAIRQYEAALKIDPENPKPYFNLANVYFRQGKIHEAVSYYKKAIQLDPDYAKAHYNLANVYSGLGQKEFAIAHFKEAIRSNPDFAEAHQNLAADLIDMGRTEEAKVYLKSWSESRPK